MLVHGKIMFRDLQQICRGINKATEYLLSVLGLSMAVLVAVQVFFRYALNHSLFWSEELARYLLVWLTFLGATVAYYRGLHPGVNVLTSRLPQKGKFLCRLIVFIISGALFVVMIISGAQFSWFVRNQVSPALDLPKWVVTLAIPFSGTILLLYVLCFTREILSRKKSHDH